MSANKNPSIFLPKWRLLCLLSFKYSFYNTRNFENWGIYKQQPPFGADIICSEKRTVFQERSVALSSLTYPWQPEAPPLLAVGVANN